MKRAHSGKNRKKRLMVILIVMVIAISVMANQAKENGVESMRSVVKDPIGAVNKAIAVPKKWVSDRKYSV
ncbi:MAG: rod shape-determining protein MreC, partial [Enterococcus sp.]